MVSHQKAYIVFHKENVECEPGFIVEACEDLGVPFGCRSGNCGTCEITVISGMENLSPQSSHEQDFGLADNHRLACQCVIKGGKVEIKF